MSRTSFLWFLPTSGDGRYLVSPSGRRPLTLDYAQRIATSADALGYDGMLLPTGVHCEDAWTIASALIPATQRLKFLIALRPGLIAAPLAARMAATFDRLSNGRLLINVVSGSSNAEHRGDGLFLDHDERYDLADEYLTVWRELLEKGKSDFDGRHVKVEKAQSVFPAVQRPHPPLYFGGSSPAGIRVAARHIDTYLTWGEPPQQVAEKIATVRAAAKEVGRPADRELKFGIRLHVVVRDTVEKAWDAANDLLRDVDDDLIARYQAALGTHDSEGQRRMQALHGGKRENLEVSPNLWAGVGLVRGGAGTVLVGDPQTVADRINEYRALGISSFVLSGYPHLEEAYRFAEDVVPLVRASEIGGTEERELRLNMAAS